MSKRSSIGSLFELRGQLSRRTSLLCEFFGVAFILAAWTFVAEKGWISRGIFPSPIRIISSLRELHFEDALVRNLGYSFSLNLAGIGEAVALAIPLGFLIGLFPIFRSVFLRYITALRYLPLSALVGVFIALFGIFSNMKVQFLAFSIFIYLLPAVIQRIDEVETVYQQTAYTLGATRWQMIRTVFIPPVLSRVWDDVRNLSALSWTYIIIAEMVNASGGGVGALTFRAARQSRIDKVFMILVVIIFVGFLWDKLLILLDEVFFPYKKAARKGGRGQ
jgi:NitT/TauT family transport system permease protein